MVQFINNEKTETIQLPSYPGSEIVIKTSITIGEQRKIMQKYPQAADPKSQDAIDAGISMITTMIKEWNFTKDAEGKEPLPITEDNIGMLPNEDFQILSDAVTKYITTTKKN